MVTRVVIVVVFMLFSICTIQLHHHVILINGLICPMVIPMNLLSLFLQLEEIIIIILVIFFHRLLWYGNNLIGIIEIVFVDAKLLDVVVVAVIDMIAVVVVIDLNVVVLAALDIKIVGGLKDGIIIPSPAHKMQATINHLTP